MRPLHRPAHAPLSPRGLPAFTINRPLARLGPVWWSVAGTVAVLAAIEAVLIVAPLLGWLFWPDAAWTGLSLRHSPLRNIAVFYGGFFPVTDSGLGGKYSTLAASLEALSPDQWARVMTVAAQEIGLDNLRPADCHASFYAANQHGLNLPRYWEQNHCAALQAALIETQLWQAGPAPQLWHGLSAQLLHGGPLHLAMNLMGVLIWMPFLVVRFGLWRMAVFTLLTMIASAAAFALWTGAVLAQNTPMIGFSGVVFALLGAHLRIGWRRGQRRGDTRAIRSVILAMVAVNLVFLLLNLPVAGDAHLGGMLAGFSLAGLLMPDAPTHKSRLTRMSRAKTGAAE